VGQSLAYTWHVPAPVWPSLLRASTRAFVEALDLPNKPATSCLESLPAKKKPGKTLHLQDQDFI